MAGWWYGVVGHLESCNGDENYCRCHSNGELIQILCRMIVIIYHYFFGSGFYQTFNPVMSLCVVSGSMKGFDLVIC